MSEGVNEPVNAEPRTEIERLQGEIIFLKSCGIVELAVMNPNVLDYMKHWEDRAEKAEEALMKERERCAVICEEQESVFGSLEYRTDQPYGSMLERLACRACAAAIRGGT